MLVPDHQIKLHATHLGFFTWWPGKLIRYDPSDEATTIMMYHIVVWYLPHILCILSRNFSKFTLLRSTALLPFLAWIKFKFSLINFTLTIHFNRITYYHGMLKKQQEIILLSIEKINYRKLEISTKINNPLIKRKASFKNHIFKTKNIKISTFLLFLSVLLFWKKRNSF